jgi:dUTP pyrophosphatase
MITLQYNVAAGREDAWETIHSIHAPQHLDAGMDLRAVAFKAAEGRHTKPSQLCEANFIDLEPGQRCLAMTGLVLQIPEGFYGRIAPRSGLAWKHGIDVLAGVVDPGYRGEVGVVLVNFGDRTCRLNAGDRVAQLVITPYAAIGWVDHAMPTATKRGDSGFGSTGRR